MRHPLGDLRAAQRQVVILRAVERPAQPAHLLKQRLAHHHQVADVVPCPQVVRAEVRLEVRVSVPATVLGHLVLVGINQVGLLLRDHPRHLPQRVRLQQIVMVTQGQPLARGKGRRAVCAAGDALVALPMVHMEPPVQRRSRVQRAQGFRPGGAIIVKAGLPFRVGLGLQGRRQRPQQGRLGIVHGNQHGDQPRRRGRLPLRFQLAFGRTHAAPDPLVRMQRPLRELFRRAPQGIPHAVIRRVISHPAPQVRHAFTTPKLFTMIVP